MNKLIGLLVLTITGCATLHPGAEQVKIVGVNELQRLQDGKCREVGEVNSGGQDISSQAYIVVRNDAQELGANVVLSSGLQTSSTVVNGNSREEHTLKGIAFICGPEVYNRLIDLSKI